MTGLKTKVDFVGLSLIALGLGCLQIVLDRGEDEDWLSSAFIRTFAILTVIGISGAIAWLLYAKNPIVNIRVLADRNFAMGCVCIFTMAAILYSSAVLLPQLAQRELGYTATWAGLILSPGALMLVMFIPVLSKLILPRFQTRYIIGFGFFVMGCAMLYSHHLASDIDFRTLATMRATQSFALGFLFVPISTIAYRTIPPRLNGDAAALNTMFRNVAGSIGISVATALVTTRTQVHMGYLSQYMTPLYQPFNEAMSQLRSGLQMNGTSPGLATSLMYNNFVTQSSILAYEDVFSLCAVMAFAAAPLCFLFSSGKGGRAPAGAH